MYLAPHFRTKSELKLCEEKINAAANAASATSQIYSKVGEQFIVASPTSVSTFLLLIMITFCAGPLRVCLPQHEDFGHGQGCF